MSDNQDAQVQEEDIGKVHLKARWKFWADHDEQCWRDVVGGPGDAYIMQKSSAHEAGVQASRFTGDYEFRNWGDNVVDDIDTCYAPTTKGLPVVLKDAYKDFKEKDITRLRLVGSGHSWAPLFAGKNGRLIMTKNCRGITYDKEAKTITVSAGDLVYDLEEKLDVVRQTNIDDKSQNRTLAFTTVETTFSVSGIVAPGCHGSGGSPNFSTGIVGDMVESITIARHGLDGTVTPTKYKKGDPAFHALMLNLGAMGVMERVEFNTIENTMAESKHYNYDMKKLFGHTIDSMNALRPRVALTPQSAEANASVVRDLMLSHEYLDINWCPFNDTVWVIQINKKPEAPFEDGLLETKQWLTERWKKAHLGAIAYGAVSSTFLTQLATPLVCKTSYKSMLPAEYTEDNPRYDLVPLKSALHWEVTCDAMSCRDLEMCFPIRKLPDGTDDFRPMVYAWNAFLQLMTAYKQKNRYPVNLFGQIRIVSGSPQDNHALLCPTVNVPGKIDRWCYMECLTTKGNKYWPEFMEEMEQVWLMIDPLAVPHWAKDYTNYTPDHHKGKKGMENFNDPGKRVQNRLHHVYGTNLRKFEEIRQEFDPINMYKNKLISWVLEDIEKITEGPLLLRNNDPDAGAGSMWDEKWAELAHIQLQLVLNACNTTYPAPSDEDIAKITDQLQKEDPQHRPPVKPVLPYRGHADEEKEIRQSNLRQVLKNYKVLDKFEADEHDAELEAALLTAGRAALKEAIKQKAKRKYRVAEEKRKHNDDPDQEEAATIPDFRRAEQFDAKLAQPASYTAMQLNAYKKERVDFHKEMQETNKKIAAGKLDPLEELGCDDSCLIHNEEAMSAFEPKVHRISQV